MAGKKNTKLLVIVAVVFIAVLLVIGMNPATQTTTDTQASEASVAIEKPLSPLTDSESGMVSITIENTDQSSSESAGN